LPCPVAVRNYPPGACRHASQAERTSVKPDEIYAAEDLADQLGTAIGLREQAPQVVAEAVRNRNAAFTLFIETYEEIRAAVGYLRRQEGDARRLTRASNGLQSPSEAPGSPLRSVVELNREVRRLIGTV
jgi:hypothetical protein